MSFFEKITGRDRSGDSRRQVRSSANDFTAPAAARESSSAKDSKNPEDVQNSRMGGIQVDWEKNVQGHELSSRTSPGTEYHVNLHPDESSSSSSPVHADTIINPRVETRSKKDGLGYESHLVGDSIFGRGNPDKKPFSVPLSQVHSLKTNDGQKPKTQGSFDESNEWYRN